MICVILYFIQSIRVCTTTPSLCLYICISFHFYLTTASRTWAILIGCCTKSVTFCYSRLLWTTECRYSIELQGCYWAGHVSCNMRRFLLTFFSVFSFSLLFLACSGSEHRKWKSSQTFSKMGTFHMFLKFILDVLSTTRFLEFGQK